jgi:hypothetical protein
MSGGERVVVESPYAAGTIVEVAYNRAYLQACLRDCLLRGEYPFASHHMYTEALDDQDEAERELGIVAGLDFARCCVRSVFYTDLGMSPGMVKYGHRAALESGREIEHRKLGAPWS